MHLPPEMRTWLPWCTSPTPRHGRRRSISPFTVEDDILDAARSFSVANAESYSNQDKQAILSMIDMFSNGGSAAFERKIAEVAQAIVGEKTGRSVGSKRGLLHKSYSMGEVSKAPARVAPRPRAQSPTPASPPTLVHAYPADPDRAL